MPYCNYIYNALTIDTDTKIRPCCHVDDMYSIVKGVNIDNFDVNADTNFPKLAEAMKEDWHPACQICKDDEDIEKYSARQRSNDEFERLPNGQYSVIDLKLSNTCNLACVMCGPGASSTWTQIVKQNPDITKYNKNLNGNNTKFNWTVDSKVHVLIQNARFLKLNGGEPFLIKDVKKICRSIIDSGRDVSNVKLEITTNGNVVLDDEWYDILNAFKTELYISVDGYGSRYEYIRPGSSWTMLLDFIHTTKQKFSGKIMIAVVAQALNYIQLPLMRKWAQDLDVEIDISEILYHPYFLNISSVNPTLREKYGIESIHEWEPKNFEKMKLYLERLDQIHGTDFKKECGEFFDG